MYIVIQNIYTNTINIRFKNKYRRLCTVYSWGKSARGRDGGVGGGRVMCPWVEGKGPERRNYTKNK